MSAAFVFGQNERKAAITNMWELATEVLGVNADKIWVSYFGGGELAGQQLPEDSSTHEIWREFGVPENRLVGLGVEHNYWVQGGGVQHGETELRKCGPNTELFYDRNPKSACSPACLPGCPCGRFIEFSNTLFISHTLNPHTNEMALMTDPFTETVMGTERAAMILQGVDSVFDTQNYRAVIGEIQPFITKKNLHSDLIRSSMHIIVDHIRALCILVKDGAPPPGKNGRARLIKLLIRGIITRQIMLGIAEEGFISAMIQRIAKFLAEDTEITLDTEKKIMLYIETERSRFNKTIELGTTSA